MKLSFSSHLRCCLVTAPAPRLLAAAALSAVGLLSGCAVSGNSGSTGISTESDVMLTGRVQGGQQPIQSAAIYLYAAGTTGNGTGAANLLTTPVSSKSDGTFSITSDYTCPSSSTQVYLVAAGGNPGLSPGTNNTASLMMAALGDCGSLSPATYIFVDEVTTVAAAWTLTAFLGPNGNIGATATNATGLRNAFLNANNLVNTTTGQVGGTSMLSGATVEASKLNSLANSLSTCVNSAGGSSCTSLLAAATVNGVVPANTLDAARAIVSHPLNNVAAVYNVATATPPFQPALSKAPHEWTMSLTFTGGGISYPTALALDSKGSVWVANYLGGSTTKLSSTGIPASAAGYADPALRESYGIAVDTQDNAWVTNEEGGAANMGFGTISEFSSTGQVLSGTGYIASIYYPYAIAADSNGDMWVADFGRSQASLLNSSGASLIGANGYSSPLLPLPLSVALDSSHNAWFATQGAASKVTPGGAITEYPCCQTTEAIAVDGNQNVWVTDYSGSALVELSPAGVVLQTLTSGGLYYPEGLAVDGNNTVWVANYRGASISGFTTASGGAESGVLSSPSGLGLDASLFEPFGIAADASGDVWVTSFAGASVTEFVGLSTPLKTPIAGPPVLP